LAVFTLPQPTKWLAKMPRPVVSPIKPNLLALNAVTRKSATGVAQAAAAANQLSSLSENLSKLVGRFKVA
jgi:hypothetical protein